VSVRNYSQASISRLAELSNNNIKYFKFTSLSLNLIYIKFKKTIYSS